MPFLSHVESGPERVPGFVLPIFKDGSNDMFVQEVGIDGRVRSFRKFDSAPYKAELAPGAGKIEAKLEEPAIWAFRNLDGNIVIYAYSEMVMFADEILGNGALSDRPLLAAELVVFGKLEFKYPNVLQAAYKRLSESSPLSANVWRDTSLFLPKIKADILEQLPEAEDALDEVFVVTSGQAMQLYLGELQPLSSRLSRTGELARLFDIDTIALIPKGGRVVTPPLEQRASFDSIVWASPAPTLVSKAVERQISAEQLNKMQRYTIHRGAPFVIHLSGFGDLGSNRIEYAEAVHIVIRTQAQRDFEIQEDLPGLSVVEIVSEQGTTSESGAGVVARDILNVITLISETGVLQFPSPSVFVRSGAPTSNDINFAVANIFEVMMKRRAKSDSSILFTFWENGAEPPAFALFGPFKHLEVVSVPQLASTRMLAAGLFPTTLSETSELRLIDAAEQLCRRLGWDIGHNIDGSTDGPEFIISNQFCSFKVWVRAGTDDGGFARFRRARDADEGFLTLELSLNATMTSLAARSDFHDHVLMSVRDLAEFRSTTKSIWPLIGAQVLRSASHIPSQNRTQYYKKIFEAALTQPHMSNHSPSHFVFSRCLAAQSIVCARVRKMPDCWVAEFRVAWAEDEEVASIFIQFDDEMVSVQEYDRYALAQVLPD